MKLSSAQTKAIKAAMKKKYRVAAFDIDGTLTHLAKFSIPGSLVHALANLPGHIPLVICTGRDVEHVQGKLAHICDADPENHDHRSRWYIICENGGATYSFNCKDGEVKKIFEIKWPSKKITKDALEAFIKDKLGWHAHIVIREYSLVVRFPNLAYLFPKMVRKMSKRTAKELNKILTELKLDKDFSVQDSGIGNVIIPSESGKGKAVGRLAKKLKIPLKDVFVVGDQAGKGENDEEFLSGKFGTAFTVGKLTKKTFPLPVLDQWGKKLNGPEGTEFLLREIHFK